MARTGRPKAELTLSGNERATLHRWARRARSSQALALRANIILTCAQGYDNKETAALLRCHQVTVGKWRKRFIERRLDGVADEPRPGPGLLTWSKRSRSAVVFFDLVLQGEPGAGVAGFGGVELLAERGQGTGAAGRAERVEPDVQDAACGGDVAAGGEGFADEGVRFVAGAGVVAV